MGISEGY